MSDFPEYAIRRILVALDASTQSLAALQQAAEMASALQAELIGLFVKDINLLRSARYPFVQRVAFPSGAVEQMDVDCMERELQVQAQQARRALAEVAEKIHRPWSFRCVRGSVTTELRDAAGHADVVMLGRAGWAARRADALGSTASELARSAPGAVLIVAQSRASQDPVQALFDGSQNAARVLRTAASYAFARGVGLVVHIPVEDDASYARLLEQAKLVADHRFKHVHIRRLTAASPSRLANAIAVHGSGLIMIPGSSPLADERAIREIISIVQNPVLLIRDDQPASESRDALAS